MYTYNTHAERDGDELAQAGQLEKAAKLWQLSLALAGTDVMRRTSLGMKLATLPYRALVQSIREEAPHNPKLRAAASHVDAQCGEIVASLIVEQKTSRDLSAEYRQHLRGAISEAAIIYLGARHYRKTSKTCILPADYDQDHAYRRTTQGSKTGYDALGYSLQKHTRPTPIQVKTSPAHDNYEEGIVVVAVSDLGHPAGSRQHGGGLPDIIAHEVAATVTQSQKKFLNAAQLHLQALVFLS